MQIPDYGKILDTTPRVAPPIQSVYPECLKLGLIGRSSQGKTNFLIHTLLADVKRGGLIFNRLFLVAPISHHQAKYTLLEKVMAQVKSVEFCKFTCLQQIHDYAKSKASGEILKAFSGSVVIFDDVPLGEKRYLDFLTRLFFAGRHFDISLILLHQSWANLPKSVIREQFNMVGLFRCDEKTLKLVHRDIAHDSVDLPTFKRICALAWQTPFVPLVLTLHLPRDSGFFKVGLTEVVRPPL